MIAQSLTRELLNPVLMPTTPTLLPLVAALDVPLPTFSSRSTYAIPELVEQRTVHGIAEFDTAFVVPQVVPNLDHPLLPL